ncbi:MAG: type II secretion system F family protein [Planctomycetota bacterium]
MYAYRAVDEQMAPYHGSVTAETPRQARDQLRDRGLLVEALSLKTAPRAGGWLPWQRRGRYDARLVPVVRELATLLSAAIPLSDALETTASQQRGPLGESLERLTERVSGGVGLAEAMREQPVFYDDLTVQMVEVGENAGNLDVVLDQLADFRERYVMFKDRVVTALFYPLIVLAMGLGVSLFLMTFVVPMLLDNLLSAGQSIPWPTRVLRSMSDALREHGFLLLVGGAIGGISFVSAIQTKRGKRFWHGLLLKAPLLGGIILKQELARVALILGTLLESGIVFVQAMEIATRAVKNQVLADAFGRTQATVQAGADIGEAMEEAVRSNPGLFPPLVLQIFSVGQKTGRLEPMLARLATDYERQVTSLTTRLTTLLEPALIVALAVFVGFILFATMLPILEAGNVLQ